MKGGVPSHAMTSPTLWSCGARAPPGAGSDLIALCRIRGAGYWDPHSSTTLGSYASQTLFLTTFHPLPTFFFFCWMKRKGSASERMIEVLFNFTFYMEDTGVKAGSRRLIPIHQFVCKHVITKSDADQQFKFCPSCSEISSAEHL